MNQRSKRTKYRKNNVGQISVGSSAHPARQDVTRGPAEVVVPPSRATGDIKDKKESLTSKLAGLAKASPLFRKVDPRAAASKEEEEAAIRENTVEQSEDKSEDDKD